MKKKFNPNTRQFENLPLKEILQTIVEGYHLDKKINQARINEVWGEVMGNGIKAYTSSIYLRNDTLFVKLTSAIVRDELSYGKSKIINNINQILGREVIKDLRLI